MSVITTGYENKKAKLSLG